MKRMLYNSAWLLLVALTFSCDKEDTKISGAGKEGFWLYWHHDIFGEGRNLLLDFTDSQALEHDYDLHFKYRINNREIIVELAGATDRGECPKFPMPNQGTNPELCNANGYIRIPDAALPPGTYTLRLLTDKMVAEADMIVSSEKISMNIPPGSLLSSEIKEVFPIPRNILFGSIHYSGSQNEKFARDLIDELKLLGLKPAEVPDLSYRYLDVKRKAHLSEESWQNDEHSIALLYDMSKDFRQIIDIVQKHYQRSDRRLKFGIYSSNGDQAILNGGVGDNIVYAP
jgi:hypothetical protein